MNRNIFWAKTFVDELARCGLEAVVIAPGSRSTPLVIAFAENQNIKVYSQIDERCASFFALGLALASNKPVAVLCSSGTATANFHPAVIEAKYSNVPLLVLTADRQHELRDSGANQTVDQIKMFGDHVLWFYDVALPEAEPPAVAIRNLRTLADRAYATANGIVKGAVHLNFPFRKPLEPIPVETDKTDIEPYESDKPFTRISRGVIQPLEEDVQLLAALIAECPRGFVICGQHTITGDLDQTLITFRQLTHYPIFADALSNLRQLDVIGGYDGYIAGELPYEAPDLIIHIGAMPASGNLETYLNKIQPKYRILLTETGKWTDAYHRLTHVIQSNPSAVLSQLSRELDAVKPDVEWSKNVYETDKHYWDIVKPALDEELFDGSAVAATLHSLTSNTLVYVASSLPVRHVEQFAEPGINAVRYFANRGASGIDGTISSAMGVAVRDPERRVLLITGDLAFYHDLNGLLAAKRCNIHNITIVLINNDGGGIFHRLPIANFEPPFTDLFLTPHGLDFEPAIRMYGFEYHRAGTLDMLRGMVKQSMTSNQPTVIEVRTDSKRDLERRKEINQRVLDTIREKFATPNS